MLSAGLDWCLPLEQLHGRINRPIQCYIATECYRIHRKISILNYVCLVYWSHYQHTILMGLVYTTMDVETGHIPNIHQNIPLKSNHPIRDGWAMPRTAKARCQRCAGVRCATELGPSCFHGIFLMGVHPYLLWFEHILSIKMARSFDTLSLNGSWLMIII